jgi:hypothetical protein
VKNVIVRISDGAVMRNGDHICTVDGDEKRAILKSGVMNGILRKKMILVSWGDGSGLEVTTLERFGLCCSYERGRQSK